MDNIIQTLKNDIDRLKKNKSALSEDDIRGKYKNAYRKLCNQIIDEANEVFMKLCFHGMYINPDDDCKEVSAGLGEKIDEIMKHQSELRENIRNSLLIDCDYEKGLNDMLALTEVVWEQAYGPYFKISSYQDNDGYWHNKIMGERTGTDTIWTNEWGWMSKDGTFLAYPIDYQGQWIRSEVSHA